jgi:hypothetical protein
VFEGIETFEATRAAEKWLEQNGYSVGESCAASKKRAIKKGAWLVAKWRNLTAAERGNIEGMMTAAGGDFRRGPVIVELYV